MRLFISYSNVDRAICREIAARLETAHDVWYDKKLTAGQDWKRLIDSHINSSDIVLWLLSPESIESPHCQEEVRLAQSLGKPVLPVRLQDNAVLPEAVKHLQIVDLSDGMGDFHLLLSGIAVIERDLRGTPEWREPRQRELPVWAQVRLIYCPATSTSRAEALKGQLADEGCAVHLAPMPAIQQHSSTEVTSSPAWKPDANIFLLNDRSIHDQAMLKAIAEAQQTSTACIPLYEERLDVSHRGTPGPLLWLLRQPGIQLAQTGIELEAEPLRALIQIVCQDYVSRPRENLPARPDAALRSVFTAVRPSAGPHASAESPILFIGPAVCPAVQSIRSHLVARLSGTGTDMRTHGLSSAELLEYFAYRFGRSCLIAEIRQALSTLADELPGFLKETLALPFEVVVSTCLEPSLDRIMHDLDFKSIYRPEDAPDQLSADGRYYFKLAGSLDSPPSLILTQHDMNTENSVRWTGCPYLMTLLSTRRLLFLGYDIDDPDFQSVYASLILPLDRRGVPSYILSKADDGPPSVFTRQDGLTVVPITEAEIPTCVNDILQDRSQTIEARTQTGKRRAAERPYKFLDFYEEKDSDIFFGRERESSALLAKVLSSRLVLLYGMSGTGKTSLINAGLIPAARSQGFTCTSTRLIQNPSEALRAAINASLGQSGLLPDDVRFEQFMPRLMLRSGLKLLLVFDQFEELFIHHGDQVVADFVSELGGLYNNPLLQVKFLLSIREDYLPLVSGLDRYIPDVFHNYMRLHSLTEEQALDAIVKPAELHGVSYEPGLARNIVSDLTFGGIEAPQLQIVCDQLFELAVEGVISSQAYSGLGGARGILSNYTSEVLRRFASEKRPLVSNLLKHLVTVHGTKDNVTLETLAHRFQSDPEDIRNVIESLIRYRLLRPVDTLTGSTFELAHDYLAEEIRSWMADSEIQEKAALHLLSQELETWKRHGTVMDRDRFKIVNEQRPHIELQLTSEENAFGLLCSLQHNEDVEEWLKLNVGNTSAKEFVEIALESQERTNLSLQLYAFAVGFLQLEGSVETALATLRACGNPHLFPRLKGLTTSGDPKLIEFGEQAMSAIIARSRDEMVYIEPGRFIVGTPQNEVDELIEHYSIDRARLQDEAPEREERTGGFWIDRYPVTNARYHEFDPEFTYAEGKDAHPAVNLNFSHAQSYARWWGKELPSETEWERAARGADGRRYTWGDDWVSGACNTEELGVGDSTPVDAFPDSVSPTGCYDMLGNVWEWVDSWFDERLRLKVCKGGGWAADRLWARCAARHRSFIGSQFHLVGFRCVMRDLDIGPDE
jgi:formylglycine-generating enzyme required for sulfatase activity